jgi:hypothetical protein
MAVLPDAATTASLHSRRRFLGVIAVGLLSFIVSERPDGIWIKWFPESEQQDRDVSMSEVRNLRDREPILAQAIDFTWELVSSAG